MAAKMLRYATALALVSFCAVLFWLSIIGNMPSP